MERPAEPPPPIVVPLDGSDLAAQALDVAVALLGRGAPSLTVVSTGWSGDPDADRAALHAAVDDLARPAGTPPPEVRLVPDRPPAEVVVAEADLRQAAVCMATHGRGGVRRALLGSVAEEVVREAGAPVVLAGPALARPGLAGPVVVCIDGSDVSTSVLPDAIRWAGALDGAVHVVLVDADHPRAEVGVVGRRVAAPPDGRVPGMLDGVAGRCRGAGLDARVERLQGHDVAATIAHYAAGVGAALVAVTTHGRSGVRRTALGSVATDVVRRADCPVLVRRPGAG